MDNEALVRALRKFEQQNESLKKAVSALQSEADARDYLVTQILLGLNVPRIKVFDFPLVSDLHDNVFSFIVVVVFFITSFSVYVSVVDKHNPVLQKQANLFFF